MLKYGNCGDCMFTKALPKGSQPYKLVCVRFPPHPAQNPLDVYSRSVPVGLKDGCWEFAPREEEGTVAEPQWRTTALIRAGGGESIPETARRTGLRVPSVLGLIQSNKLLAVQTDGGTRIPVGQFVEAYNGDPAKIADGLDQVLETLVGSEQSDVLHRRWIALLWLACPNRDLDKMRSPLAVLREQNFQDTAIVIRLAGQVRDDGGFRAMGRYWFFEKEK